MNYLLTVSLVYFSIILLFIAEIWMNNKYLMYLPDEFEEGLNNPGGFGLWTFFVIIAPFARGLLSMLLPNDLSKKLTTSKKENFSHLEKKKATLFLLPHLALSIIGVVYSGVNIF